MYPCSVGCNDYRPEAVAALINDIASLIEQKGFHIHLRVLSLYGFPEVHVFIISIFYKGE